MRRRSLCFLLLFACTLRCFCQNPPDLTEKFDSLFSSALSIGVFNGVVLIASGDRIIYQKAFGRADAEAHQQLSPEIRFQIGSISKEFNAAGIALLQQQGKLRFDEPVGKYLTWLPAWSQKIKVRDLLQYTAGLPSMPEMTESEYRKHLLAVQQLAAEPGTVYSYDNVCIYLQKQLIEQVSGIPYSRFVRTELLDRAGMSSSTIDDAPVSLLAKPFDNDFKAMTPATTSSGWTLSTAGDLHRWSNLLNSGAFLNAAALEPLAQGFPGGEASLGHALLQEGKLAEHQHDGSGNGYEALLYSDTRQHITVILLSNNQNFKQYNLKDAAVAILHGESFQVPKKSLYLDLRTKALANLDAGIAFYQDVKQHHADHYDLSDESGDLNSTAKYLMRRSRYDEALSVLQLAATLHVPETRLSYIRQLIAQCYAKKNDRNLAIVYYKLALENDPKNQQAQGELETIERATP